MKAYNYIFVLFFVQCSVIMSAQEKLVNLKGLEKLTHITGNLSIISNQSLESLKGIQNLKQVTGTLEVNQNSTLSDCSAICELALTASNSNSYVFESNKDSCNSINMIIANCISSNEESIFLYPNPSNDLIRISNPKNIKETSVQIINNNGQVIQSIEYKKGYLDISRLTEGSYILKVQNKKGIKFIKK